MESEDDNSPDPPLPDIPAQSRTLLHYFSKVKTEQVDKKASQPNQRTKVSEKSEKKSATMSSKSALSAKNTSNDINPIVQDDLTLSEKPRRKKRKTKNNDIVEDIDNTPISKKVRATIVTGDSIDENKDESTIEKNSKGINSFFAAISKEEYRRESEKQAERVKLTITAQVHTPDLNAKVEQHANSNSVGIDKSYCLTPTSQKPIEKLRNRRCSFTNVVRPTSETDTIKVVERENVLQTLSQNNNSEIKANIPEKQKETREKVKVCHENTCSDVDERSDNFDASKTKTKRNQSKVSDKLFQRKKRKVDNSLESSNDQKNTKVNKTPDDSVDVDFFNMQMTVSNVEEINEKENTDKSLFVSTLPASPEGIDFQPSPKKVRSKRIRTLSGDKGITNHLLKLDREKVVGDSLTSEKHILSKKQTLGNRNQKHSCISDADNIDCNKSVGKSAPVTTSEKTPTPVSLFKHKDPPKKKYNKKTRGTDKTNAVNGIAHVNYDSDSIDLDLLATYNAKTFHSAASGELSTNAALDSSNDETNNVFSALMKKPLTQRKSSPTTSPNNCSNKIITSNNADIPQEPPAGCLSSINIDKKDQIRNNSQDNSNLISPQTMNVPNAFQRLMSSKNQHNAKSNLLEKDNTINTDLEIHDSPTDSTMTSIDTLQSEVLSTKMDPTLSFGEESSKECLTPKPDQQAGKLHTPSTSQRRCSSRIQRNIEIAEAKKREVEKFEDSPEPKKDRSQHIKRKSLISNEDSSNKHSSEISQSLSINSRNKAHNKVDIKPKPTAAIFLIGKKKYNIHNSKDLEEDPEKQAARKAFLLSSVPQSIKTQVDLREKDSSYLKAAQKHFSSIGHITQMSPNDMIFLSNKNTTNTSGCSYLKEESYVKKSDLIIEPKCKNLQLTNLKDVTIKTAKKNFIKITSKNQSHRLDKLQIYNHLKFLKQIDQKQFLTTLSNITSSSSIEKQTLSVKPSQAFPVKKIFRRYLERKLEADSIEFEARKKNVSLTEMEEERLSSTRKLRRRVRGQSNIKIKNTKSNKKRLVDKTNFQNESCDKNLEVSYDPTSQSSMLWTIKYSPKIIDDIIGNGGITKKLQKWLGEWEARDIERKKKRHHSKNEQSDSSDIYSDDSEISSEDERMLQNTAILVGPNGVGKTATVYALAHEMGFKVLELNASSTRSGRQVLANLREATQSHSVKQEKSKEEGRQGFDSNKKSQNNCVSNTTEAKAIDKTTVILFEDIDIVFEDLDEGFHNAINSLISTTKRPIVMTTSSQNFMACSKNKVLNIKCLPQIFEFRPIQPRIIAKYLQLLCLVEGFCINYDSLLGLTLMNKGNVSTTIHQLQYWIRIYGSKWDGIDYNLFASNVMKIEYPRNESERSQKPKPVEKEDSLAKLMSVDQTKQNVTSEIYSLLHCSLSPIGMKFNDSFISTLNGSENSHNLRLIKDDFLFKLQSVNFFEAFDWSRHILLPFHMTKNPERKSRAIHYPLTAIINNENSTASVTKKDIQDLAELKSSRSSYKRIKNNDSFLLAESDENITPDESELFNNRRSKDEIENYNEKTSLSKNEIHQQELQDKCTNECSGSSDLPLNEQRIPKYQPSSTDKFKSLESAKNVMKTLSDYTDCISEFMPLQDDQPFWLQSNHKNSNCSSQLCANSNFYESYKKTNNFQLFESYCSCNVDECLGHEQILAQEITANVIHLTLQKTQNSIQRILSKETDLLELSVQYPTTTTNGISNSLHDKPHDKLSENLGTVCIDEMDRKHTAEYREHHSQGSLSNDLVCETASNKDFERGFDDNYVKQLHNAEREVLQSFFIDPIVNIGRYFIQDALPVIRGMARIEEHRKASGLGYSKKRTSRSKFLHYFETQNLYTLRSQTVLNTLCNSFQST